MNPFSISGVKSYTFSNFAGYPFNSPRPYYINIGTQNPDWKGNQDADCKNNI